MQEHDIGIESTLMLSKDTHKINNCIYFKNDGNDDVFFCIEEPSGANYGECVEPKKSVIMSKNRDIYIVCSKSNNNRLHCRSELP